MQSIVKVAIIVWLFTLAPHSFALEVQHQEAPEKNIAYLVSDQRIPFWDIMWRGIQNKANMLGYKAVVYSAENSSKKELELTIKAIRNKVSGIIVSPTNSSACVTILNLAKKAGIPVVISDIGTDSGDFVSYISSNNEDGAYQVGQILAKRFDKLNWQDGRVGIIAIPQKRANGKARTAGFMRAMNEAGIKGAGIKQQVSFSYQETYDYSSVLIKNNPNLRALFLQGSDRYQGALDAIADANKSGDILVITFDAEPEFIRLIPEHVLVGAGMQQPFLMGERAVDALDSHLKGQRVDKEQKIAVLAISNENITKKMSLIKRNVLGLESQ